MKKMIFVPAILLSSVLFAAPKYNYEVTPQFGYNFANSSDALRSSTIGGVSFLYNGFDSWLSPELSVLYSNPKFRNLGEKTNDYRIALNGVHEFDDLGFLTPLMKFGIGYETMNRHKNGNTDSAFFDAGLGAKINIIDNIALKLETVYMLKENDIRWDNNLALLAGVSFAFGAKEQPQPIKQEVAPAPVAAPAPAPAPAPVVVVDGDDDNDGVKNSIDKCPNTPKGHKVDKDGCSVLVNLHVNFATDSYKVDNSYMPQIKEFADFMKSMPNYDAKIVGHTDSTGSDKHNQVLSENRAKSVKDLIVKEGVDASRVTSKGMGKNAPIADNKTKEGRAENRRIEAELTKK